MKALNNLQKAAIMKVSQFHAFPDTIIEICRYLWGRNTLSWAEPHSSRPSIQLSIIHVIKLETNSQNLINNEVLLGAGPYFIFYELKTDFNQNTNSNSSALKLPQKVVTRRQFASSQISQKKNLFSQNNDFAAFSISISIKSILLL